MTQIESQVSDLSEAIDRITTTETNVSTLTARTLTAGTGLTGGGDLSADRVFNLANTGVTPSSLGSPSKSVSLTVDAQGRITAAGDANIAIPVSQLTDYQTGTWSPVISLTTPPTTPFTMDVIQANYTKIGRLVTVQAFIKTDSVDTAGSSGFLVINGLPFTSSVYAPVLISTSTNWVSHPSAGYVDSGSSRIFLLSRTSANGGNSLMGASDLTSGAIADQNQLMLSATYFT